VLVKVLRLAYENGKLLRIPVIHKLKVNNVRKGFFEPEMFERVRTLLPEDYQLAITIAYTYGWRMQSEILTLEWRQVDIHPQAGTLRLDPGTTKNDDGRMVYLTPELAVLLAQQRERVQALERAMGRIIPYVFPHLKGLHKGERIQDFKKAWKAACTKAGCPGMLRHDFRRTAVRNMVNLGIRERVAMEVTGHKTRSVFDRYDIVNTADHQEVAKQLTGIVKSIVTGIVSDMPANS
jgi:integrase